MSRSSDLKTRRLRQYLAFITTAACLGACGGGGGGGTEAPSATPVPAPAPTPPAPVPPSPVPPPAGGPTASVVTPSSGKAPWNVEVASKFSLKSSSGATVDGTLNCQSDSPESLSVAADCSVIKGLRLGNQTVTVSAAGITAKASVKVIPQALPIGVTAMSKYYNAVITPQSKVLVWGWERNGYSRPSEFTSGFPLPRELSINSAGTQTLKDISAMSVGTDVTLALTEDGEIWSWGTGYVLGRPTSYTDHKPGKVVNLAGDAPLARVVSASVGERNAIALLDDGSVMAWGSQLPEQLGYPTEALLRAVALPAKAVAVTAGHGWSAVLLADGRVMTYGIAFSGSYWLGRVTAEGQTTNSIGFVLDQLTGQPITDVVSLSAGRYHGLALTRDGRVYTWGENSLGVLGQNTFATTNKAGALRVKSVDGNGELSDIVMAVGGGLHSLALDKSGKVYSWGSGLYGVLGQGPTDQERSLPVPVAGTSGTGQLGDISAIAAGAYHSVALASDGRVLIWGSAATNNLGQGGALPNALIPIQVKDEAGTGVLNLGPVSYWPNLLRRGNP